MRRVIWAVPLAALAVLGAAWAMAQTAPPTAPPFPAIARFHGMAPRRLFCENRDALLAGALAFVHTKLEITAGEEQAWQRFGAAAQHSMAALAEPCATLAQQHQPTTLPDRLALAEKMAAAHLQVLQSLQPALGELYSALTPEQRQRLDALPFGSR
jgi:hypothetical protein